MKNIHFPLPSRAAQYITWNLACQEQWIIVTTSCRKPLLYTFHAKRSQKIIKDGTKENDLNNCQRELSHFPSDVMLHCLDAVQSSFCVILTMHLNCSLSVFLLPREFWHLSAISSSLQKTGSVNTRALTQDPGAAFPPFILWMPSVVLLNHTKKPGQVSSLNFLATIFSPSYNPSTIVT